MTKPYRPSSGTEGADFAVAFCCRCRRDEKFWETNDGRDGCPIAADMFAYDIADSKYPKELIVGDDGFATCTAFQDKDKPEPRDENAAIGDLFA